MVRPTKKEIKRLKSIVTSSILNKIKTTGYKLLLEREVHDCICTSGHVCLCGSYRPEYLVVDLNTESIPVVWHAGIEGNQDFRFGHDLARVEFASEEAKRKVRDLFSGHEGFVTWAWYN